MDGRCPSRARLHNGPVEAAARDAGDVEACLPEAHDCSLHEGYSFRRTKPTGGKVGRTPSGDKRAHGPGVLGGSGGEDALAVDKGKNAVCSAARVCQCLANTYTVFRAIPTALHSHGTRILMSMRRPWLCDRGEVGVLVPPRTRSATPPKPNRTVLAGEPPSPVALYELVPGGPAPRRSGRTRMPSIATPVLRVRLYDGSRKSVVSGSVQSGRRGVESVSSSSARLSAARS